MTTIGGDSFKCYGEQRKEPLASKFKPGDMVRWAKRPKYDEEVLRDYKTEFGPGPFEVVEANPSTEKEFPPQIRVRTLSGVHTFGETWFAKSPREGEICEQCHHRYERRTMFFSVDASPSCWCQET
jgi:hypothetical protein